MKNAISLDQMLKNIKERSEDSRLTIEAAEKTIKIINKIVESREALGLTQRDLAKKMWNPTTCACKNRNVQSNTKT